MAMEKLSKAGGKDQYVKSGYKDCLNWPQIVNDTGQNYLHLSAHTSIVQIFALVCVARRLIRIQDIHVNAFHFPVIDADEAKVHIIFSCYNC